MPLKDGVQSTNLRHLKEVVHAKLPPGDPFREVVLGLRKDEVEGDEATVLLKVLMRLLMDTRKDGRR